MLVTRRGKFLWYQYVTEQPQSSSAACVSQGGPPLIERGILLLSNYRNYGSSSLFLIALSRNFR